MRFPLAVFLLLCLAPALPSQTRKKQAPAAANPAAQARRILAKARAAHGGDAVLAIDNFTFTGDMTMATPQGEMSFSSEGAFTVAGKSRMVMKMPVGDIVQVFDGNALWTRTMQGVQQMPPAMVAQAKSARQRDLFFVLRNFDQPGFSVTALPSGSHTIEGKTIDSVRVAREDGEPFVTLLLDRATGLAAGKTYVGQGMMGSPGEMLEVFGDIREVEGVRIPFRTVISSSGKRTAEQRLKEFKINPGVDESAFQRPQ